MRRIATAALVVMLSACGGQQPEPEQPDAVPSSTAPPTATPSPPPSATPEPGSTPPGWLFRRPLPKDANGYGKVMPTPPELQNRHFTMPDHLPALPGDGFASRVDKVPDDVLARSSWTPACPVSREDLRWVRLTFHGFDERRHTGELLVSSAAANPLVSVFSQLWDARFPLEEMRITRADELDAEPTGDGSNTGAFTCKPMPGGGWSEHAKGMAIDVNPFHNPYVRGALVLPELASAYLDRDRDAPGMIRPGDAVTRAFASIGWQWGGSWQRSKDYMHLSANGR
jgi:hypothetical protein